MNDDSSSRPSLLERITHWLSPEPENREELLEVLRAAHENNLLDADALSMVEGVMQVSEMQVREIMIPRAQMDVVDINESPEKLLPYIIETAHSRFPAVDGDRDNVLGILLAKDLLRLFTDKEVNLREILRPAVYVPESKRLNILLREFRSSRNHIAIVVDEYGGAAGLVTSATSRTNTTTTRTRTTSCRRSATPGGSRRIPKSRTSTRYWVRPSPTRSSTRSAAW